MTKNEQVNASLWRAADVAALEERVKAIQIWIAHTNNLLEMFEGEEEVLSELRSVAGRVRTKSNDLQSEADRIRAELVGGE